MDGMRILITGVTGYIGRYLAGFLKNNYPSCKIYGVGRCHHKTNGYYDYHAVDLLQEDEVFLIINHIKPHYIFHLAGLVFSYDWHALYSNNVMATNNLLEAVRKSAIETKVIVAGSSAEYGAIAQEHLPVTEAYPTLPSSPYGMTKLWQTQLSRYYCASDVSVIVGRIFNVIGYGAAKQLTTGDFFEQIIKIIQEEQAPQIFVGNLQIKRDFLDIEDVCTALIALAQKGLQGGLYNICSGYSLPYETILKLAITLSKKNIEIIYQKDKPQNTYTMDIYGCNKRIKTDTSWSPEIKLEESIRRALFRSTQTLSKRLLSHQEA